MRSATHAELDAFVTPGEGFTLRELALDREAFEAIARLRSDSGLLRPAVRRWLTCWLINQHAFFRESPDALAQARVAHYLGWCLGGRDTHDHAY